MRRMLLWLFSLSCIVMSAACSGTGPTSPSTSGGSGSAQSAQGLPGTWLATRAEFVSATNTSLRVEIISKGSVVTLSLEADGSYAQMITDPGQQGTRQTGAWSASRDVLTLRPAGVSFTIQFDYTLNGNTLTLAGGHVEFDLNGDGTNEETILNATLARQ